MEREPQTVSRREFLQGSGTVLAGMAASSAFGAAASAEGDDRATGVKVPDGVLGRTGVRVSRLGIGCEHFKHQHVAGELAVQEAPYVLGVGCPSTFGSVIAFTLATISS